MVVVLPSCITAGKVKVKTDAGEYEVAGSTNGVSSLVVSNSDVVVEIEGE
jgi:hypothetical protein